MYDYEIKDRKFIGEKIRKRRKNLALSQEELSELIGITYQQLQRYENGSSQVGTDRLQALARSLKVSITYFFENNEPVVSDIGDQQLLSFEETKFLKYLRKISKKDYKQSVLVFLKLAAEMESKKP